jgi:Beta-lactamase
VRLDDRRPITMDDRFSIGSLSKRYTATLTLQLVDGGELSLADSVERWLPGLIPGGEVCRVKVLRTWCSSYTCSIMLVGMAGHDRELRDARTRYVAAARRLDEAIRDFRSAAVPLNPGPASEPIPWSRRHVQMTNALARALLDVLDKRKTWDQMRHEWQPPH